MKHQICKAFLITTFLFISSLLLPQTTFAASYYVATNGNDSNPGTENQPWRTIQKAANTMTAGDSVRVAAGTYPERVTVSISGTSGAMITYNASGEVTTQGFTVNANYITIRGFYITGTDDNNTTGWGIYYKGSNGLIEDNHVYFATRGGIILATTAGNETGTSNCVIRNNKTERNQDVGIEVHGRNHLIESNDVWNTIQYHPNYAKPPGWVDADGFRFFGSGHIFRKNYVHDILYGPPGINPSIDDYNNDPHIDCFQTFATDAQHEVASNTLFEQNICINEGFNLEADLSGKGFQQEGASKNLVFRNNLVKAHMIAMFNDAVDLSVIHNTFVGDSANIGAMGIFLTRTSNAIIQNNIFAYQENGVGSIWPDTTSAQTLVAGYNCVYRTGGAPSRPADPFDVWNKNPLFVNETNRNFHLQANSPCIDAGKTLNSVADDFDGVPRPQGAGYDIGAFEYSTDQPTPTPTPIPLPGDINQDGTVDILDFTLLSNAFGTNNPKADINSDGVVNILDYTILSNNFGKSS